MVAVAIWRRPEYRSALQRPCERLLAHRVDADIHRGRLIDAWGNAQWTYVRVC